MSTVWGRGPSSGCQSSPLGGITLDFSFSQLLKTKIYVWLTGGSSPRTTSNLQFIPLFLLKLYFSSPTSPAYFFFFSFYTCLILLFSTPVYVPFGAGTLFGFHFHRLRPLLINGFRPSGVPLSRVARRLTLITSSVFLCVLAECPWFVSGRETCPCVYHSARLCSPRKTPRVTSIMLEASLTLQLVRFPTVHLWTRKWTHHYVDEKEDGS